MQDATRRQLAIRGTLLASLLLQAPLAFAADALPGCPAHEPSTITGIGMDTHFMLTCHTYHVVACDSGTVVLSGLGNAHPPAPAPPVPPATTFNVIVEVPPEVNCYITVTAQRGTNGTFTLKPPGDAEVIATRQDIADKDYTVITYGGDVVLHVLETPHIAIESDYHGLDITVSDLPEGWELVTTALSGTLKLDKMRGNTLVRGLNVDLTTTALNEPLAMVIVVGRGTNTTLDATTFGAGASTLTDGCLTLNDDPHPRARRAPSDWFANVSRSAGVALTHGQALSCRVYGHEADDLEIATTSMTITDMNRRFRWLRAVGTTVAHVYDSESWPVPVVTGFNVLSVEGRYAMAFVAPSTTPPQVLVRADMIRNGGSLSVECQGANTIPPQLLPDQSAVGFVTWDLQKATGSLQPKSDFRWGESGWCAGSLARRGTPLPSIAVAGQLPIVMVLNLASEGSTSKTTRMHLDATNDAIVTTVNEQTVMDVDITGCRVPLVRCVVETGHVNATWDLHPTRTELDLAPYGVKDEIAWLELGEDATVDMLVPNGTVLVPGTLDWEFRTESIVMRIAADDTLGDAGSVASEPTVTCWSPDEITAQYWEKAAVFNGQCRNPADEVACENAGVIWLSARDGDVFHAQPIRVDTSYRHSSMWVSNVPVNDEEVNEYVWTRGTEKEAVTGTFITLLVLTIGFSLVARIWRNLRFLHHMPLLFPLLMPAYVTRLGSLSSLPMNLNHVVSDLGIALECQADGHTESWVAEWVLLVLCFTTFAAMMWAYRAPIVAVYHQCRDTAEEATQRKEARTAALQERSRANEVYVDQSYVLAMLLAAILWLLVVPIIKHSATWISAISLVPMVTFELADTWFMHCPSTNDETGADKVPMPKDKQLRTLSVLFYFVVVCIVGDASRVPGLWLTDRRPRVVVSAVLVFVHCVLYAGRVWLMLHGTAYVPIAAASSTTDSGGGSSTSTPVDSDSTPLLKGAASPLEGGSTHRGQTTGSSGASASTPASRSSSAESKATEGDNVSPSDGRDTSAGESKAVPTAHTAVDIPGDVFSEAPDANLIDTIRARTRRGMAKATIQLGSPTTQSVLLRVAFVGLPLLVAAGYTTAWVVLATADVRGDKDSELQQVFAYWVGWAGVGVIAELVLAYVGIHRECARPPDSSSPDVSAFFKRCCRAHTGADAGHGRRCHCAAVLRVAHAACSCHRCRSSEPRDDESNLAEQRRRGEPYTRGSEGRYSRSAGRDSPDGGHELTDRGMAR